MTSPTPIRFPPETDRAIAEFARRAGSPKSTVVVGAVEEWLRMQTHPRVLFTSTNTGERRATLVAGPQVWTVAAAWRQHPTNGRNVENIAGTLDLTIPDLEAALAYWAAHRDEIDRLIELHETDQDAALSAWEQRQALDVV